MRDRLARTWAPRSTRVPRRRSVTRRAGANAARLARITRRIGLPARVAKHVRPVCVTDLERPRAGGDAAGARAAFGVRTRCSALARNARRRTKQRRGRSGRIAREARLRGVRAIRALRDSARSAAEQARVDRAVCGNRGGRSVARQAATIIIMVHDAASIARRTWRRGVARIGGATAQLIERDHERAGAEARARNHDARDDHERPCSNTIYDRILQRVDRFAASLPETQCEDGCVLPRPFWPCRRRCGRGRSLPTARRRIPRSHN
jgi:hypothetical protein